MPSIVTHAFVGAAAVAAFAPQEAPKSVWFLASLVSVLPDLDVLAVIKSEFRWVWLPMLALLLIFMVTGWVRRRNKN